jgi:AraC-like DNA-binding protein
MRLYSIEDRKAPFIEVYMATARHCGYDARVIVPGDDSASGFDKFCSVYRHLSVNPVSFELSCFRRYFEVLRLCSPGDRFIIADSDLFINAGENDLPACYDEMENGLIGSSDIVNGVTAEEIAPHFSLWTHGLLRQFVDYLVANYESEVPRLQAIHAQRSKIQQRVAISDMTLLHLFVRDTGINFVNTNHIDNGKYVDHNLSSREALNGMFRMEFGFKTLSHDNQGLLMLTEQGVKVRPAILHLQGRAKIAATDLYAQRYAMARGRFAIVSAARFARKWLA